MPTCKQIDGEGDFLVGHQVPSKTVEGVVFDACDAETLPA
jgi:hypothetical protein